ncbi:hypothetical protein FACS189481_4030 [Clostridia bacterium]|nr:hypothetical protein FACS189481_4030 [Clostridia bacterium]
MSDPIVTVKDYERDKIYRLNRRIDGLNDLLQTFENTKIQMQSKEKSKDIQQEIETCQKRIQKWWDLMSVKHSLPQDKELQVSFDKGDIFFA